MSLIVLERKRFVHGAALYQSCPGTSGEARLGLGRTHPVIDRILQPLPKSGLLREIAVGFELLTPGFHDFSVDGPKPNALARDVPAPVLSDLGTGVGETQGDVAG